MKKENRLEASSDIIKLILEDHKPLKHLIKVLKDSEADLNERQAALIEFAPLLINHAHSEERALYKFMEKNDELREESFEGEVEHQLAEQMLEAVINEENDEMWSAKAKVLAELVEHHINEEEEEMLPDFKKESSAEERQSIGEKYLQFKQQFEESDSLTTADNHASEEATIYPTH